MKCICLALFTTLCGRGRHRDDLRALRSAEQTNHKNSEREWEVEMGDYFLKCEDVNNAVHIFAEHLCEGWATSATNRLH